MFREKTNIAIIIFLGLLACEKDKATAPPRPPTIVNIPIDYPTIQQGINASVDGDTLLVQPGNYVENININGHNILLGSLYITTGDFSYVTSTIIDGDSAGPVVTIAGGENSNCILVGFTIQNGHNGILCSGSNPFISNNIIKNNHTDYLGGGIYCGLSSPSLNNNLIFDNSAGAAGGGVYCSSSSLDLRNNLIINNYAGNSGGGIYLWGSNPVLTNNTICGNSAYYAGGGIRVAHSSPTVINTILWANNAQLGAEINVEGMPIPVFRFCDIEGGWEGEGNINCHPAFCYPDTGNYYLADSSCCAGAGENGEDIGAFGIGCN